MALADCVPWEGAVHVEGYGQLGRNTLAHRHVYEQAHGPVPEGRELHHVCDNRLCVNVEHLIAVTRAEHLRIHRSHDACPHCGSTRPRIQNMRNGKPNGTKCRDCHNRKNRERRKR